MDDDQPYLIAHKVRGQPAFDIAIQMFVEGYDEPWWIVATSGHRAYPYWSMRLADCFIELSDMYGKTECAASLAYNGYTWKDISDVPSCPQDWPDHYQCDIDAETLRSITVADITKAQSLLQSLGLIKPKEPIRRRI